MAQAAQPRPNLMLLHAYINDVDAILGACAIINVAAPNPDQRRITIEGLLNVANTLMEEARDLIERHEVTS